MQRSQDQKKINLGICFLVFLGINCLFGVLCCIFLAPHFRTNDDMIIHLITSGAYGAASEYTGFVNVLLSKALMLLQRMAPGINHFAVLQFASMIFAESLFEALLFKAKPYLKTALLSLLLSGILLFRLSELHYTATAFVLSSLGLASLLISIQKGRKSPFAAATGAVLALLGSMLRFNAFLLASVFIFLPFLLSFIKERGRLTKAISFSLVFVLAFATTIYNNCLYEADPLTAGWLDFCEDRQQISDYALPDYSSRYIEYMQLGISENDFELIENWLYADRELFPAEMVSDVADIGRTATAAQKLWFSMNDLRQLLPKPYTLAVLASLVVVLLINGRKGITLVLLELLMLMAAVAFCLVLGRITAWVLYGAMTAFVIGELTIIALKSDDSKCVRTRSTITLCALLFVVLGTCVWECAAEPFLKHQNTYYHKVFAEVAERYPDELLLCTDIDIMSQHMAAVFEGVPANEFGNIYVLGGWDDALPAKTHVLRLKGITSPIRALAERDDVLLMDKDKYGIIVNAVYEYCGFGAGFSVVDTIGGYRVFSVSEDVVVSESSFDLKASSLAESYFGADVYSICVSSDRALKEGETAYIRLSSGSESKTYRCRITSAGDTLYESVILAQDMSAFGDYEVQLILMGLDGNISASNVIPLNR